MVVTSKQQAILLHVARYGISLRPVLNRLFYPGSQEDCDFDLKQLREEDLLKVVPSAVPESLDPRSKYSYYHLTRKACGMVGAPDSKGKKPGGFALRRGLAILWFCCMGKNRGHRLNQSELERIFAMPERNDVQERAAKLFSGFHCIVQGSQSLQVHNVYATEANDRDTLSELKRRVEDARRLAAVAQAIQSKQYVFTLLVETQARRDELRNEIAKHCGTDGFVFNVVRAPASWRERTKSPNATQ